MQRQQARDSAGRPGHDADEQQAEIELPCAGDVGKADLQESDDDGADDRPREGADAADIGHQQHEARLLRAQLLRIHDLEIDRREPAGRAGEERGKRERDRRSMRGE